MVKIEKVGKGTELAEELLRFVENCSWAEVKDHTAAIIREWRFNGWETMFAAVEYCVPVKNGVTVEEGKIVGMASLLMTDYYPLPEIYPWVSCIFVTEEYRGRGICGQLISAANEYARRQGFDRSYIPTGFTGLYERYGYRYVKDIVNYGGGADRLYVKEL